MKNKNKKNFKEVVLEIIKDKKVGENPMTLYNVAKNSKVSMSNMYRWDKNLPNVIDIYKVSKYLKVSIEKMVEMAIGYKIKKVKERLKKV